MTGSEPQPDRLPEARGTYSHLGGEVLRVLGAYVWGQTLVALILTGLYATGLSLLHVPWWFLLAPLCGFLNLIPMFGGPFGMLLTLFVAWVSGAGLTHILLVAGVFVAVMTLESYFLTPRILGRRLGLNPLLVFLGVLAGGMLFGFFGILLAVPAMAVANAVWRHHRGPRRA